MDSKPSPKAARMRQAWTFSLGRDRTSIQTPSGVTCRSPSCPPSNSTSALSYVNSQADSTGANNPTCHKSATGSVPDSSCYFDLPDEPGDFRPKSPLIDRQHIDEDILDDVKYACRMLAESLDRGLPMWAAGNVQFEEYGHFNKHNFFVQDGSGEDDGLCEEMVFYEEDDGPKDHGPYEGNRARQETGAHTDSPGGSGDHFQQRTSVSPTVNREYRHQASISWTKMHDSGVAFQPNAASAAPARFYGQALATSHYADRNTEAEEYRRGRSRGRDGNDQMISSGPAVSGSRSRSCSRTRSRSISPNMFPYSPPRIDTLWPHRNEAAESRDDPHPENWAEKQVEAGALDAEGLPWLHPKGLLPHQPSLGPEKTPSRALNASTTGMAACAPHRFYSMQSPTLKEIASDDTGPRWSISSSRTPSVSDETSVVSAVIRDEKEGIRHIQPFYQVAPPAKTVDGTTASLKVRHTKRRKASSFWKKLTGLGRKKENGTLESPRAAVTV
ncbi:hypothetical protein PDE_09726 [Penicillium oxalicum 114-2]|uniref:Uncharacterized protein n=1 Tax=Penicillium oxalicum (strain 114-2 / CGMCC 5302) TaxID=933388 RepID=S8BHR3_PENO1|nr:hypothetical protein PDE_09726 [Penicillium oxalicum 114-2]